ncbi:hypothetical protein PVA17_23715 [Lysinibacillus sp. CNPSo 3705]|nr:hypothetical protein [Lysinibacillus sp. CNPSo 3705]MDD1505731.1 hypothetical protein [Lysinibacillus sp. CNPSo 3705]
MKQTHTKTVERFLERLNEMSGTGNGIGKGTVNKIRSLNTCI